jgi:cell division protein FtsB
MSQVNAQSNLQEVDVTHVNALLQAVSDQRNSALNTVAQVQAENAVLRQRMDALAQQNQALAAQIEALRPVEEEKPSGKPKAA